MKVPVRTGGLARNISIEFADEVSASLVTEWRVGMDAESSDLQRDSFEFLESVAAKWEIYERRGRVVRSFSELVARVEQNQVTDVMGVLTASADWYRNGAIVGFCEFRRTWCNNIVFDFLGIHPWLLVPAPRQISGLGTALLYRLAGLAMDLGAGIVWAETTDTSAPFYRRLFDMASLSDLLAIPTEEFFAPLASAVEAQRKEM